ncbi:unnamed protein product [marine sediment metagenome]|uniref:Uncharacterized protein n=1 Tax=marine sediment metagenome TaxID=412755 RepID=X1BGG8_9ZZZZ
MYISVKRDSNNYYWYGSSFSDPTVEHWIKIIPIGGNWEYKPAAWDWVDGSTYTIRSKGVGPAGEKIYAQEHRFLYDTTQPDSFIEIPGDGQTYQLLQTLSGTAEDKAGSGFKGELDTEKIKIAVKRLSDNHYWSIERSS